MRKILTSLLLIALMGGLGLLILRGIQQRMRAETALAKETGEEALLTVNVVRPKGGAPKAELVLPGNIEAFTDTPVYARTDGYLKRWNVDIGARVKAGQLLADIETPEIDQQLWQARAQLATAQATYQLAQSTAARWQSLLKTESVSRQETDEKLGDLAAKKAVVDAAAANVKRLEEMQSFQKIYAPFDGVITARNIDIGSLVNAGSNGSSKELFHLTAIHTVRVYVQVPQVNSQIVKTGTPADLTLAEFPGRRFRAHVVRTASAIDMTTRTLKAEVDVDNPGGLLLPGAFAEVHLNLPSPAHALTVPVNTTLFRSEGMSVAAVREGRVALVPIQVGHDYGDELEVISSLNPDEQLIANPPDSIVAGQRVRVAGVRQ